jgi:tRNA (guanosine-2'-O-)-methyltransferase
VADDAASLTPKSRVRDEQGRTRVGEVCISRGVETCFDARDDNCNGLVDEGCGLPDGPLQILIAWEPPEADVDLEVFDPAGEPALVGQPTAAGLVKDRDCPKEPNECGGQNVEVVYLDGDRVPPGRYLVTLRLHRPGPLLRDVTLRLGGHMGNDPLSGDYTLSSEVPEAHFELERDASVREPSR